MSYLNLTICTLSISLAALSGCASEAKGLKNPYVIPQREGKPRACLEHRGSRHDVWVCARTGGDCSIDINTGRIGKDMVRC